eukprot:1180219-Prorocentrum_minimum.AAC.1
MTRRIIRKSSFQFKNWKELLVYYTTYSYWPSLVISNNYANHRRHSPDPLFGILGALCRPQAPAAGGGGQCSPAPRAQAQAGAAHVLRRRGRRQVSAPPRNTQYERLERYHKVDVKGGVRCEV